MLTGSQAGYWACSCYVLLASQHTSCPSVCAAIDRQQEQALKSCTQHLVGRSYLKAGLVLELLLAWLLACRCPHGHKLWAIESYVLDAATCSHMHPHASTCTHTHAC
jgi:hypothetical protein